MSPAEITSAVAAFRLGPPLDVVFGRPEYVHREPDPHLSIPRLRGRDGGPVGAARLSLRALVEAAGRPLTPERLHRWMVGWLLSLTVHEFTESVLVDGARILDPHHPHGERDLLSVDAAMRIVDPEWP